jgi:DNA modification methylase
MPIKLSEIKPNPRNPRVIKDEKFKKLVQSIKDFPKMLELRPMVIDENNTTLGGNMRLKALEEIGYDEIPDAWVKKADELTEDQKREFIIKDNIGYGEWDWETLTDDWEANQLESWGLDLPDFEPAKEEIEEDEYDFADSIVTDIALGDLFQIGNHRLLCGDSTDADQTEKLMDGAIADMVFTDPDFSMSWELLRQAYSNSIIHSKGFGFWICGDKQAVRLAANDYERFSHFYVHDFRIPNLISNTRSMQRHTLIVKFGTRKINNLNDGFSTLIQVATDRAGRKEMPMAKKIELPATFIQHYTDTGNIVLDLFGHSGSTMMACEQLNRRCYMQELEPKYCYAIVDRFLKKYPETEIKRNGDNYLHKSLEVSKLDD